MDGIYKITAGQWDANGELVEDDTDYYAHQGVMIEVPVIGVRYQVPPPGVIAYLLIYTPSRVMKTIVQEE